MDKNTLWGLLMMAAVIFGFMWLNQPSAEEIEAKKAEAEAARIEAELLEKEGKSQSANLADTLSFAEIQTIAPVVRSVGNADEEGNYNLAASGVELNVDRFGGIAGTVLAGDTLVDFSVVAGDGINRLSPVRRAAALANVRGAIAKAGKYGSFANHISGEEEIVRLENNLLSLELSTKGGRLSRATLKDYDKYLNGDTANVELISPETSDISFSFTSVTQQRFETNEFYFTPVVESDTTVLMNLDLGNGATWGLRYTLRPESYLLSVEIVQNNMDRIIPSSVAEIAFSFGEKMARNEIGRTFEERNSALTYMFAGDTPEELNSNSDDSEELNQPVKWIAFKNQFFSMVVMPRNAFSSAKVSQTVIQDKQSDYLKDMKAETLLGYNPTQPVAAQMEIYLGPNLYPLLSDIDNQVEKITGEETDLHLTRLVPLGWSLFRWISTLVIIPVFTFLSSFISNYGLIIFLLTLFIKIVLFPFTYKSFMSQAKMRVLAPEIKAINEKYPGQENAMTRNQKTMELYSKAGASPLSGCLPMLLQMPILIAMFWFFPSCIELRGESFLWCDNLAAPDYIFTLPFRIPWYGDRVSLFCLIMTAVNIIYTRINMQNQPSQASMPMMKWMMYLMPVMFLFIFNDYAAGLSYYYFLSLLITILMTYIFRKSVDEEKLRKRMAEAAKKPRKKSGFLARLEEAQRQQQAALREQQKRNGKNR